MRATILAALIALAPATALAADGDTRTLDEILNEATKTFDDTVSDAVADAEDGGESAEGALLGEEDGLALPQDPAEARMVAREVRKAEKAARKAARRSARAAAREEARQAARDEQVLLAQGISVR